MRTGSIVVGLDGSAGAAEALRWAVREGDKIGAPVLAIHAYHGGGRAASRELRQVEEALARSRATAWFRKALGSSDTAQHLIRLEVAEGPTRAILVRFSRNAAMLVVGQAGTDRTAPGDSSLEAECPVVIVPNAPDRPRATHSALRA